MKHVRQYYLIISAVLILIGCIGTFAEEPGIYSAVFALGIVFLILGAAEKSKKP